MPKVWTKDILNTSEKRRADPLPFFVQFLSDIWKDNTPAEAESLWRIKAEHYPWYADDALFCVNAVLAEPPVDLVELMQRDGWLMLTHELEPDGIERPFSFAEHVEFLQNMSDQFRTIYDEYA